MLLLRHCSTPRWLCSIGFLFALSGFASGRASAAPIIVYNTNDNAAGSLRQAIQDANASPGADTISFTPGVTGLITLTTGPLMIASDLTIQGPGARFLIISGNNASRVFTTASGAVNISGLTIANGYAPTMNDYGAGILNTGSALTLRDCTITNNHNVNSYGGGIYNLSQLTVISCTFSVNTAVYGGGIRSDGILLTVTNSTFTGNSAGYGGGIMVAGGTTTMGSCTLSNNHGTDQGGGGVYVYSGTASIGSSLIAGNTAPTDALGPDVNGTANSNGYNLIGKRDGSTGFTSTGDQTGTGANPLPASLGPLTDNGDPTPTMALLPGSLAIDQSKSTGLATDQRGAPRPYDNPGIPNAFGGDGSDIGAYEVTPPRTLIVMNTNDAGTGSLRQVILDSLGGDTVTFAPAVTGVISLTSGELAFANSLIITGPGANLLTISGSSSSRVFNITGGTVAISGLTIANGYLKGDVSTDLGGGIYDSGNLTINACTISGCQAYTGGGIYGVGALTINNTTIAGNTASGTYNTPFGGGLLVGGPTTMTNCTVTGNRSMGSGGGVYMSVLVSAAIQNSTISDNSASTTAGGLNSISSTVTIGSSILAGNRASTGPDCYGSIGSTDYNLIGNPIGATISGATTHNLVGTPSSPLNPRLGLLQYNGGPTPTMALLSGSPAIDAGNSPGLPADQRGLPRPVNTSLPNAGDGSDIGAYEVQSNWQASDLSASGEGKTRLLWSHVSGSMTEWSVANAGSYTAGPLYGPYPGFTSRAIASGGDGLSWTLWNRVDGQATLWITGQSGAYDNALEASFGYGPYPGFNVSDVTIGIDGQARILWTHTSGAIVVWSLTTGGNTYYGPGYGPYPGFTARAIAGGPDGLTWLLWNKADGTAVVWLMGQGGAYNNVYEASYGYGPYPGWTATDITVAQDGRARLLWTHSSGLTSVWSISNNGNAAYGSAYGPYPGWNANRIAAGADGLTRVLWNHTSGMASVWIMGQDNAYQASFGYGPY